MSDRDAADLSIPRGSVGLLPGLHGLRAIAATSVVLFHLHHLTGLALPSELNFVATHFGLGVQLFFVLSTFSLFYSTVYTVVQRNWASKYFIKRYFRIAPLFYFMLAAWCALFFYRGVDLNLSDIVLNLLLVFNFVPGKHESIVQAGWTVGVEVVMYVLLPLLFLVIQRLSHAFLFACIAIAISLTVSHQLDLAGGILQKYSYFSFASSLGSFALGILAFKVFEAWRRCCGRQQRVFTRVALFLAFLIWVSINLGQYIGWSLPPSIVLVIWCLFFAVLVVTQAIIPAPIIASRFLVFLGERSYGIYLTHPMVIFFLTPINMQLYSWLHRGMGAWAFLLCGILTLIVVICVSSLIYLAVERPGMRLGHVLTGTRVAH